MGQCLLYRGLRLSTNIIAMSCYKLLHLLHLLIMVQRRAVGPRVDHRLDTHLYAKYYHKGHLLDRTNDWEPGHLMITDERFIPGKGIYGVDWADLRLNMVLKGSNESKARGNLGSNMQMSVSCRHYAYDQAK